MCDGENDCSSGEDEYGCQGESRALCMGLVFLVKRVRVFMERMNRLPGGVYISMYGPFVCGKENGSSFGKGEKAAR